MIPGQPHLNTSASALVGYVDGSIQVRVGLRARWLGGFSGENRRETHPFVGGWGALWENPPILFGGGVPYQMDW